jgi:Uma2 family endonuclease
MIVNRAVSPIVPQSSLPDHTQLPETDGSIVENFEEHPQSILLTDSLFPVLQQLYPDGQFAIGQDSGIYWRNTDPPLRGCLSPDWYVVPGVSQMLEGQVRRSYVLWQELINPLLVVEFVSGDGSEERDRTPGEGKFWIYERRIRPAYYAIYEFDPGRVEVYQTIGWTLEPLAANERGHYPIAPLGIELGIREGTYLNAHLPWLRCWDAQGKLLLTGHEIADAENQRADKEQQRADKEQQRADAEKLRAERLSAKLRALGVNPDEV